MRRPLIQLTPEPRLALVDLGARTALADSRNRWADSNHRHRRRWCSSRSSPTQSRCPRANDVGVERTLPASVGIGDHLEGEYVVRSRWGMPLRARLEDDLPMAVTGGAVTHELDVPARGSTQLTVPVSGAVRGRFALGPIALRVRTRLGLMARRLRWLPDDSILVTPSVSSVRRFRLLAIQHRLYDVGVRAVRQRARGGASRVFANTSSATIRDISTGRQPRAAQRRSRASTRSSSLKRSFA